MKNTAKATWKGTGKDGSGTVTTDSNVLHDTPYSFKRRAEGLGGGTSPEELIAAAHAACFAMKLAFTFDEAGFIPELLETSCEVSFEDGEVKSSHLHLTARIKNITKEKFDQLVNDAGHNCPVSKALKTGPSIEAQLV